MKKYEVSETDIWAYVSGNANQTTTRNIEQWLNSNNYDEQLYNQIVNVYNTTKENVYKVDVESAKKDFFEAVQQDKKHAFSWKNMIKYAAVIAIIITTTTITYQNVFNGNVVIVQTDYGERKQIKLTDGSVVWLNASSKISYDKDKPRTISLIGEAFFKVAKDKKHPFTVETSDHVIVKALGTSFNVNAYTENPYTETTLFTGKVEVIANDYFVDSIIMLPNNQVTITKSNGKVSKAMRDSFSAVLAWKNDRIEFNNTSFIEIANDLSNQYNIQLRFENDAIAYSKFTGSFKSATPIAKILEILKISKEFDYKLNKETNEWIIK